MKEKTKEWAEGLGGNPFMGGDSPNGADLAVYGITRSVAGLRAGRLFAENPPFEGWRLRMQARVESPRK